ncbi:FtsK/SpoIIIE family DNA translocase [Candidatus Neptunochlamydia vexilliferae]|uniref:DNA translocase FtsK n=1 Tax=Candidatus Neptunichlamydia vexilliferae TaxID=1651774 RepID=A0ABS0B0H9_9BACT|nr:DNA translocase FtsK [Candidatus Neptunochlamydia vexilliferae]MBF5059898.1 DNA translocase FtsK [Candidatus Neptunochlamydia vexilliferae]
MDKKKRLHPEVQGLLVLVGSFLLFLCILSFTHTSPQKNWFGVIGYGIGYGMLWTFGLSAYLIATYIGWIGWKKLMGSPIGGLKMKTLYLGIGIVSLSALLNLLTEVGGFSNGLIESRVISEIYEVYYPYHQKLARFNLGGVPLYYLYRDLPIFNLQHLLSNVGVMITFSLTGIMALILFTNTRVIPLAKKCWEFVKETGKFLKKVAKDFKPRKVKKKVVPIVPVFSPRPPVQEREVMEEEEEEELSDLKISTHLEKRPAPGRKVKTMDNKKYVGAYRRYRLPPLNLLTNAKKVDQPTLKKDLERQAKILEETLLSFGVEGRVGEINCGPTITSFEVHPPTGVKVQKIKVLENDIALNLQAKSIRIIAPIPGKAAVGVEVPSLYPQEVGFKEMLSEYQKGSKKLHIPIMLGQTVTGDNVLCDLTKMPHCIIAGATGSGKSVCINSIVMSILMTARPDEVKILLVDPKKVELSSYTNLPHMIAPVITEAHGAYAALNWLVKEMEERYEILKRLKLRNIHAFNNRKYNPEKEEELAGGMEIPRKMPYIVGIIDEFADLMMASSSDLETPIARIAQMARAVGIHLILATQRPSREVITGLIKANFPSRIAFKVASRVNSQIILDENGAENLLGNGDLLFLPPGSHNLTRAQGVFVRDEDINQVIEHIERQLGPQYLIKSFDQMASADLGGVGAGEGKDDLYSQAYQIITETGTASTTFLQRKLKIGYARAASLMDELESNGIIGSPDGSRRRVLLKKD